MCEGSLHVPHRLAQQAERLQVQALPAGYSHLRGLWPQDQTSGDDKLVCIREARDGWIEQVVLAPSAITGKLPRWAKKYADKTNVPVRVITLGYTDMVEFGPGRALPLVALELGTKINVGIPLPVTGEPGVDVVKAALVELDKTSATREGLKKTIKRGLRAKSKA